MTYNQPIAQLIRKRFSCRTYQSNLIIEDDFKKLDQFISNCGQGPHDSSVRFKIIAAFEEDSHTLRGLGTYGFIKDPAGFILGACPDLPNSLLDFGYMLESIILKATDLGISTCWLGGTFRKSPFEKAIAYKVQD
jgi:nitroreductase